MFIPGVTSKERKSSSCFDQVMSIYLWDHFFKISLYLVTLLVFPSSLAIIQVHKSSWYMLHYGGPTPKRHYAFSNSQWVAKLDLGKLRGWAQRKKVLKTIGKGYDLVDHYIDAQGKKRWKGNQLLRSSELGA